MNISQAVTQAPLLGASSAQVGEDPIFELLQQFRQDPRDNKIDLGIGVYRDHLNRSPVFSAVKHAEQWRVDTEEDKAYIGPLGDLAFCEAITGLAMGEDLASEVRGRLACAQTPGGVGALRLAFELLAENNADTTLWLSDTTWQVHRPIASAAGLRQQNYAYYDPELGPLGFEAMLESLRAAKAGDAVLLQVSCHNPTGLDLNLEEWGRLADFCLQHGLLPLIDMAYHGLGDGLDADRQGLRIMAERMPELLLCYTCSKNFGLYRDRTGMVMAMTAGETQRGIVEKQWMQLATRHYFTPPAHGASLVRRILNHEQLRLEWQGELESIGDRIRGVRRRLFHSLSEAAGGRKWEFLLKGKGMFALFPLSVSEIRYLRSEHGLYIVDNGRVNLSGFNDLNFEHAVAAIGSL
ncbi:aspartate/tyrosine/aromatic aminotransferase [Pseudomaricurvus alkylphenolicus]|uniref:amino acid aminotransferase n=1 Tax=Pseudomaricurvus alkylphenolicus TaxID=1306991 RepID=UPI001423D9CF|nr:aromatic amino acid transaminase [Pseudomaricurvus alkylphenolicus]NIB41381.1 aspartate/tyrosine/aromatic aminotransferase [Pseudomaricurvus alkylphenolicus]